MRPRWVLARNASPLTLDGTRTYLVGRERVAVIDPGPALAEHLDAVADAIGGGVVVAVLLTHGHEDHAGGAARLAERVGAPLLSAASGSLAPGQRTETDEGGLVALPTPGHTPDHVAFHWPDAGAVFCGDLMLGGQSTALVAAPEGDLAEYLDSLARMRELAPRVIYPAHGPPFTDPPAALDEYERHRRERLRQVEEAVAAGAADAAAIVDRVYGASLAAALRPAAAAAVACYLEHLERRRSGGGQRPIT